MTHSRLIHSLPTAAPGCAPLFKCETREPSADSSPATRHSSPVLDFIASTDTLDRYHEIIDPAGWRLDNYRRNPVFQNAHNYGDILFTIGKALVTEVRSDQPSTSNPQLLYSKASNSPPT